MLKTLGIAMSLFTLQKRLGDGKHESPLKYQNSTYLLPV